MNLTLDNIIKKSCLIGLSYFDKQGKLLKQNMLAGEVISVDKELGISIALFDKSTGSNDTKKKTQAKLKTAEFILPLNLSCWFIAPKGEFHTNQADVKVSNPDYLVTWDIHQTKSHAPEDSQEQEQQWWEWVPRTEKPQVG